jgi:adenosylcobyric acid synthase
MNPVLLKPESETGAQVIVQGQRLTTCAARDYAALKPQLLPPVLESFAHLKREADLIIVEGAGSPAEVNLRAGDIANFGFALAARVPVVLTGDIDRGGVIASVLGTHGLLKPPEQALTCAVLINRFRGDPALFSGGIDIIESRTGWPVLGVVPWFDAADRLPAEDSLDLPAATGPGNAALHVAVPRLPRIANFDDLDPLRLEPRLSLTMIHPGEAIPGHADLVILPGSKSTLADLAFIREQGWDTDILAHYRRGGHVLGICGGYQMLGRGIADPRGIEGAPASAAGLGLLDVETVLAPRKNLRRTEAVHIASGAAASGYEIHLGETTGPDRARPFLRVDGQAEGAISADGRAAGTYLHGLFSRNSFRRAFLESLRPRSASSLDYDALIETTLDELADHLERHIDTTRLLALAQNHSGARAAS